MMKKMPVVHSSASAFSTAGVFSGHGPSSKVSTTSWSRRKSNSLKCSKPNPGPPVVSISTVRATPSAFGLLQGARAGCTCAGALADAAGTGCADCACGAGAGCACGAGAPLEGALCDHATHGAHSETATKNPAAIRISMFLNCARMSPRFALVRAVPALDNNTLVRAVAPRQRPDLSESTGEFHNRALSVGKRPGNRCLDPSVGRLDGGRKDVRNIAVTADQIFVKVPFRHISGPRIGGPSIEGMCLRPDYDGLPGNR